jgi:TonB family protein
MCSMGRFALCFALEAVSLQPVLSQRAAAPDVIPFTSTDKRPVKLVQPLYPDAAKRVGIKGPVVVDVTIGKTGEVEKAQAITGPKELWLSATEAVRQWKWEPFLLNEKPVRVRTKVIVNFVLETGKASDKKAAANH